MNTSALPVWLIAIPILIGLLLIVIFGWRREMQRRRAEEERRERIRTAKIPEDGAFIATEGVSQDVQRVLVGSFMLVGTGTYGMNQLQKLLIVLERCGLEKMVGSVLLIENDTQHRVEFYHAIPAIFHDRIVYAYSEQFSAGMGNLPIRDVLERIAIWGVPIERGAIEVVQLHLRRNDNRSPSNIFLFASMGGHAPLALPVMDILYERFEDTLTVAFTALPVHDPLRDHFPEVKPYYEQRGVRGWVISDNLEPDSVTADYGLVALLVGLSDAALHADRANQVNNTFALALTREPGAVLIYQVVTDSVVGYRFQPDTVVPPRYYVFKQPLTERILQSIRRIDWNKGVWSAALPIREKGTSVFDVVLTSLYHKDLKAVEDEVNAGRRLHQKQYLARLRRNGNSKNTERGADLFGHPNYDTAFASITTSIDPEKPLCPIIVVRLASVRYGAQLAKQIAQAPQDRPPRLGGKRLALPSGKRNSNRQTVARTNGIQHQKQRKQSNGHWSNQNEQPPNGASTKKRKGQIK